MTRRRTDDDKAPTAAEASAIRETKGSVREAIGKLIGDDAAEAEGTAEKRAAAEDARHNSRPRR